MKPLLAPMFLLTLAACSAAADAHGVLEGHVTIGPLAGDIASDGKAAPIPPEVYAARKIVVRSADGESEVARVDIDPASGRYRVPLAPGTYVIDINRIGIDSANGLPKTISVASGATATLDIAIDTGIR
jgi:hypothetical protein